MADSNLSAKEDGKDKKDGKKENDGWKTKDGKGKISFVEGSFLCHTHLYIFGEVYNVLDLKKLASQKLKGRLKLLNNATKVEEQLALIQMLDLLFSNVHPDDDFLDWLAKYALWAIKYLRLQPSFEDVMPKMAATMLKHIGDNYASPFS